MSKQSFTDVTMHHDKVLPFTELVQLHNKVRAGEHVEHAQLLQYMRWIDPRIFRDLPLEQMTESLCLAAVDIDERNIFHIPEEKRTRRLLEVAIDRNLNYISLVPKELMTHALAYKVCSEQPFWMFHCPTIPITKMIVDLLPDNLRDYTNIPKWSKEDPERIRTICSLHLEKEGSVLEFVKDPTLEECVIAFHQTPLALPYIPAERQLDMLDMILDTCMTRQDLWKHLAKDVHTALAKRIVDLTGAPHSFDDIVKRYVLPLLS